MEKDTIEDRKGQMFRDKKEGRKEGRQARSKLESGKNTEEARKVRKKRQIEHKKRRASNG